MNKEPITIQFTEHQLELIKEAMELTIYQIEKAKEDLKSFLDDERVPKEHRVLSNSMMQGTLNELSENQNVLNIIKENLKDE